MHWHSEENDMALTRMRLLAALLLVMGIAPLKGQSLRFAWLSDTHIGNPTGAEDLRASVRDINVLDSIDFVILSGDITEYGSRDQLLEAKSILGSLTIPYHIIPGNHDTKWSESGATEFVRLWGSDKFVFDAGGFRFIGMHQGPIMRMGDGQFSPEDIRWLDSVITAMPDGRQPVIYVTHYPLGPEIANWYEVLDRLKRMNTQGVLVGHGHRNRVESYEGLPGVMGRSNLRARDSIGGYTIVQIDRGQMSFHERGPGQRTGAAWHTIQLSPPSPAGIALESRRPVPDVKSAPPGIHAAWILETGFTITAPPAVWDNVLITGNSSGSVLGLDLDDGTPVWKCTTGGPVHSAAAVAQGRAVFTSTDGKIYCVDASDGSVTWTYPTDAPAVACPVIQEGVVYCGASDGIFRALSLESGRLIWQYDSVGGFVETRPVVHEGVVVFGAWDGHLYGLDATSGTLRWKWKGDRPGVLYSPAACWPVASNGRIFIAAPDRMLTCIDARSGAQVWRTGIIQVRETIGLSEDGSRIFVRTMQDSIVGLRANAEGPVFDWVADIGFGYDINSAMIPERAGVVYYATKNGVVVALNSEGGALLWKTRVSTGLVHTPLPLHGGTVALSAYDGRVILLQP